MLRMFYCVCELPFSSPRISPLPDIIALYHTQLHRLKSDGNLWMFRLDGMHPDPGLSVSCRTTGIPNGPFEYML